MTPVHSDALLAGASRLVVPLGRLVPSDRTFAGPKAWNLGRMLDAGLQVPDGFCVTTRAFRQWYSAAPRDDLPALPSGGKDREALPRVAHQYREMLGKHPIPRAVEDAVRSALGEGGEGVAWVVRSSATAEDLPGCSFAGQYDSFLNLRDPAEVLKAIRGCWLSLFSERALLYHDRQGMGAASVEMAVVVQRLVPAEVSGVLFTIDPLGATADRMVIEGIPGLCEALVSGRVTPDRVVLDKSSLSILERISNQKSFGVFPNALGGVQPLEIPADRRDDSCLHESICRRVGELGRKVEQLFGGPQDIEWAAVGDRVHILQARPITGLPAAEEMDVWTQANAIEAVPEVATPMTWSLFQKLLDLFLHPLLMRLGAVSPKRQFIGRIAGRLYMNVRVLEELMAFVAGPIALDITAALGGFHNGVDRKLPTGGARGRAIFDLKRMIRLFPMIPWLLRGVPGQSRKIAAWCDRVHSDDFRANPEEMSDERLANHIPDLLRRACDGQHDGTWAAAVEMAVFGVAGNYLVSSLSRRWLEDEDGSVAHRLMAGSDCMHSAENGLALLRLAAWVRPQGDLKAVILTPVRFEELVERLKIHPGGRDFLARWREFMEAHGHQARGGMDVFQPRWSERPDFVLDSLRTYLEFDGDSDPLVIQDRKRCARASFLEGLRHRLPNPLKRRLLRWLVRGSQRGLAQRENIKNAGVRMVAVFRQTLQEAGRRLAGKGILASPDDVFFLSLDEMRSLLRGEPMAEVRALVVSRQAEFARHAAMIPPPVVVGRFDPDSSPSVGASTVPSPAGILRGLPVSPGIVTGKARVIPHSDSTERVLPGEILVAPYTDPGWTPYFLAASGLVVDIGGQLSHGSVVAREYGLPAVVNVGPATRMIRTGQLIRVDGTRGEVTILD